MGDLRTNKIDAARRQLEAAIRMFFAAEDPFAIHTVMSAAHRLLRDLAEHSGKSSFHETVKLIIRPGMEKEFWSALNNAANFLKHADADPDAILEVQEEANDIGIAICCMYYESLGYQLTPDMRGFMAWYMMMKPDLMSDSAQIKGVLLTPEFDSLRALPRNEQLAYGRQLCAMVKNQMLGL